MENGRLGGERRVWRRKEERGERVCVCRGLGDGVRVCEEGRECVRRG